MTHYKRMSYPELIREHKHLVAVLSKSRSPAIRRLYRAQKKELGEYIKEYKKKLR
jgi:hypothetical protein